MELFAKVELERYYGKPVLSVSESFIQVKLGWFSYAFVNEAGGCATPDNCNKAVMAAEALHMLEGDGDSMPFGPSTF